MIQHVIIVVPPHEFNDVELFETKRLLEESGRIIEVVSMTLEEVNGMNGGVIKPDRLINDVDCHNCDGLILIGGVGTVGLLKHEMMHQIVQRAYKYGKIVAAICVGPTILANAGILEGKKVTACISEKKVIEAKGAKYTGKNVERDGLIITAKNANYVKDFAKKIIEALNDLKKR